MMMMMVVMMIMVIMMMIIIMIFANLFYLCYVCRISMLDFAFDFWTLGDAFGRISEPYVILFY